MNKLKSLLVDPLGNIMFQIGIIIIISLILITEVERNMGTEAVEYRKLIYLCCFGVSCGFKVVVDLINAVYQKLS